MKKKPVKLQELTPASMTCFPLPGCPAVFSGDDGHYYIIGEKIKEKEVALSKRVMKGEALIRINSDLVKKAIKSNKSGKKSFLSLKS